MARARKLIINIKVEIGQDVKEKQEYVKNVIESAAKTIVDDIIKGNIVSLPERKIEIIFNYTLVEFEKTYVDVDVLIKTLDGQEIDTDVIRKKFFQIPWYRRAYIYAIKPENWTTI